MSFRTRDRVGKLPGVLRPLVLTAALSGVGSCSDPASSSEQDPDGIWFEEDWTQFENNNDINALPNYDREPSAKVAEARICGSRFGGWLRMEYPFLGVDPKLYVEEVQPDSGLRKERPVYGLLGAEDDRFQDGHVLVCEHLRRV